MGPGLELAFARTPRHFNLPTSSFTIDRTDDSLTASACTSAPNDCSLRGAILAANANLGDDTLILPAGTYALSRSGSDDTANSGDLDVSGHLTLVGDGAVTTIINASDLDRVFHVLGAATVQLSGVTLTGGKASQGGAIQIEPGAVVTLTASLVSGNTASGDGGGGINNNGGTLTLDQVDVVSNTVSGTDGGGGLRNNGGLLQLIDSRVMTNSVSYTFADGGGILAAAGQVNLTNSTIGPGNATADNGGGVHVEAGAVLTLTNSSVVSNSADGDGGGINNQGGVVTVDGSQIADNTCGGTLGGGGLHNIDGGVTQILSSTVSGNLATDPGGDGGGLLNYGGSIDVLDSTIGPNNYSGDDGGGVTVRANTYVTLTNSVIVSNTAQSSGGGLHNDDGTLYLYNTDVISNVANSSGLGGGALRTDSGVDTTAITTILNSRLVGNVSNNSHGGGIVAYSGFLIVDQTLIASNITHARNGGGLALAKDPAADTLVVTVTNSAIISNTAATSSTQYGGGVYISGGSLTLTNTTVSGNSAGLDGAGLYSLGGVTQLDNVSLVSNTASSGSGLLISGGSVSARHTLIAGNGPKNCSSSLASNGFNLDSDGTCGLSGEGDLSGLSPALGPLQDNGGATLTHALLPGSRGIDEGAATDCPLTDQRGFARPVGPACDIGAYEHTPADLIISKTNGQNSLLAGSSLTYTLIITNSGSVTATNAVVTDVLPSQFNNAVWSCAASPGSTCPAAGAGHLNTLVTLAPGGQLTFTIAGDIPPSASGILTNTAGVAAPAGLIDPVPANNTATDADPVIAESTATSTPSASATPSATASPTPTVTPTVTASSTLTPTATPDPAPLHRFYLPVVWR